MYKIYYIDNRIKLCCMSVSDLTSVYFSTTNFIIGIFNEVSLLVPQSILNLTDFERLFYGKIDVDSISFLSDNIVLQPVSRNLLKDINDVIITNNVKRYDYSSSSYNSDDKIVITANNHLGVCSVYVQVSVIGDNTAAYAGYAIWVANKQIFDEKQASEIDIDYFEVSPFDTDKLDIVVEGWAQDTNGTIVNADLDVIVTYIWS